jgi:hypothetical protein
MLLADSGSAFRRSNPPAPLQLLKPHGDYAMALLRTAILASKSTMRLRLPRKLMLKYPPRAAVLCLRSIVEHGQQDILTPLRSNDGVG